MGTCIKAWMSLNLGQIPPLTMELAALECLKNRRHHFFSVAIDPILFKLTGNEDMHNILDEFEFRPDLTTDYGVSCPWASEKIPIDFNGKNEVITFSRLFLIGSFSYLQVMRTYIKAYMRLNFGQILPLTTELAALERLKNRCHHVISVDIDPIFFKLAGNKDMHNIMNEFEFRPDRTTDYGVSCPWASKKYPHRLIMGKMVFPLFSSPEPWGSQGELIVYPYSGVRCCRHQQCLNIFSSETALPIKAKFYVEPPWEGGTKVYIKGPGHMPKMAAMPIYGKNL